jgi:phage-related protein
MSIGMPNGEPRAVVWWHGEVKSPPFSAAARVEAGTLLRRLQEGELLAMPHSRRMPVIGPRCHELRIIDEDVTWRIVYRIDPDAIVIADVFPKKTQATPKQVIDNCRRRLARYDEVREQAEREDRAHGQQRSQGARRRRLPRR